MKKAFSIVITILLLISVFSGCEKAASFDWDSSMQKLLEMGLDIDQTFETEAELTDANRLFNEQHRVRGGKHNLEIKRAVIMLMNKDKGSNCQIIEFANNTQAEDYTKFYIATRDKSSIYKIATDGPYVVLTSMKIVVETLNMDFK